MKILCLREISIWLYNVKYFFNAYKVYMYTYFQVKLLNVFESFSIHTRQNLYIRNELQAPNVRELFHFTILIQKKNFFF